MVDGLSFDEIKTKACVSLLEKLGAENAMIVTETVNENVIKSARNIPGITLTTPDRLSVLEILRHKQLVLLEGAVAPVQARFEK